MTQRRSQRIKGGRRAAVGLGWTPQSGALWRPSGLLGTRPRDGDGAMGMAKLRLLCAAVALLCAAPPGHPGAALPGGEGDGYGVKLCGREFIRAVIFTCGGSRWKRLSLLAVEPAPAAGECPRSGADGQAAVGALRSLPSDGLRGGMERTGGNGEGRAPRGASRSSFP